MDTVLMEQQVTSAISSLTNQLPAEQLEEMRDLVKAGERGIALENLCTQIYEYDIVIDPAILANIAEVGTAMGIDSKYWERISTKGRE